MMTSDCLLSLSKTLKWTDRVVVFILTAPEVGAKLRDEKFACTCSCAAVE